MAYSPHGIRRHLGRANRSMTSDRARRGAGRNRALAASRATAIGRVRRAAAPACRARRRSRSSDGSGRSAPGWRPPPPGSVRSSTAARWSSVPSVIAPTRPSRASRPRSRTFLHHGRRRPGVSRWSWWVPIPLPVRRRTRTRPRCRRRAGGTVRRRCRSSSSRVRCEHRRPRRGAPGHAARPLDPTWLDPPRRRRHATTWWPPPRCWSTRSVSEPG